MSKMQISQDYGANVKMSFEIESKQFLAGEAYPKICCKSASDIWQNKLFSNEPMF